MHFCQNIATIFSAYIQSLVMMLLFTVLYVKIKYFDTFAFIANSKHKFCKKLISLSMKRHVKILFAKISPRNDFQVIVILF